MPVKNKNVGGEDDDDDWSSDFSEGLTDAFNATTDSDMDEAGALVTRNFVDDSIYENLSIILIAAITTTVIASSFHN